MANLLFKSLNVTEDELMEQIGHRLVEEPDSDFGKNNPDLEEEKLPKVDEFNGEVREFLDAYNNKAC